VDRGDGRHASDHALHLERGPDALRPVDDERDEYPDGHGDLPVSGSVYGTNWSGAITGSASAKGGKTISSVKVAIENTTTGKWWNTTSFSATSQTFVVATGTTNWSFALPASDLTSGDAYSVSARATDSGGDVVMSSAVTFSYAVATLVATTTSLSILPPVVPYGFEAPRPLLSRSRGPRASCPAGQ